MRMIVPNLVARFQSAADGGAAGRLMARVRL